MGLNVKIKIKSSTLIALVEGEIDEHTTPKLKMNVLELLNKYDIMNIIFDFEKLSFMDSTGIGLLLTIYNKLKLKGKIFIVNTNKNIEQIIKLTGLYKICETKETYEDALNCLEVA